MLYHPKFVNNKQRDMGSDMDINGLLTVIKPSASAVAAPRCSFTEHSFYRALSFSTGFIQVL